MDLDIEEKTKQLVITFNIIKNSAVFKSNDLRKTWITLGYIILEE